MGPDLEMTQLWIKVELKAFFRLIEQGLSEYKEKGGLAVLFQF